MAKLSSSNGLEKRPKLRFPGFDEPYKQCRIGDIYAERSQRGASNMELLSVTMNDGVKPRSEIEGKDNSSEDKSNYKIVRKGDMVYNSMRMWQGANGISPCDGIVSPAYTVLMPKQEINNGYFAALFKSANLINEFRKNSQGMTSDTWNLKYPQIETIKIQIPSVSEQDKVSELFGVLDARIVAQAQLIEALKKYKRGSLSALFPKKGEITPQYRFAGFTKPWEQRKLGELPEKTYGGGTPSTTNVEYWNGNIPWLQSSNIAEGKLFDVTPKKFISQSGLNSSAAQLIPENSIAIITRVGVGKLAFLPFSYTTSQDFLSMSRLTTEPYFTVYACYKKLQSELNSVQGTSIKGITKNELLAKEIKVPSYEEQKQIGEYLANLDRLITLHQHKYDTLLSLKNAILQQMFI